MANKDHLEILKQGVATWNERYRGGSISISHFDESSKRTDVSQGEGFLSISSTGSTIIMNTGKPDLSGADFKGADLRKVNLQDAYLVGADFSGANLKEANFNGAKLFGANLIETNLSKASLYGADLTEANLHRANLRKATLTRVNLQRANLTEADLTEAKLDSANLWDANLARANLFRVKLSGAGLIRTHLIEANLMGADLSGADLYEANLYSADLRNSDLGKASFVRTIVDKANVSGSLVYAVNVWDLQGDFAEQKDLIIAPSESQIITIDNIEVAQFIYLILNNEEIRDVINTLTSKSVLILGRFALQERKAVLDALRNKLREYNLLPIVFDFDRPTDKDFTETIKTLAGLSYFVIADVTNPKSSPLELQATVPDYQIPFVPIIQEGEIPFAMMVDLQKKYDWVLNTVSYDSLETLMKALKPLIIDPAMKKRQELRIIKAQEPEIISAKEFLAKGKA